MIKDYKNKNDTKKGGKKEKRKGKEEEKARRRKDVRLLGITREGRKDGNI